MSPVIQEFLPKFDPRKHHIGLGEVEFEERGFMLTGSYRKSYRRELDQPSGVHYGGSASLDNRPGISTWTMDDFTGGAFQQVWNDPKMFSSSKGMLPSQFGRSVRTVPPMTKRADSAVVFEAEKPLCMFAASGRVVAVFPDGVMRLNMATGVSGSTAAPTGAVWAYADYDRRLKAGLAIYGDTSTPGSVQPIVHRLDPLTGAIINSYLSFPGSLRQSVEGIATGLPVLCMSINGSLWTFKVPENESVDGTGADWTRIGRLPGKWVAHCFHDGSLYILLGDSDTRSQLVQFDGTSILPVTDLPFNFVGESLASYAGRLYIGGSGRDISDAPHYGELYEVTGASVRLIRTFAPEIRGGSTTAPSSIGSMTTHEGLLFFPDGDRGLLAYDVTTDAIYGAHRFNSASSGFAIKGLVSSREHIWAWVDDPNADADTGFWAGAVAGDTAPSSFSGVIETSDFTVDFDRWKSWRLLRVLTRGDEPSGGPTAEASIDGGVTWTSLVLPASGGDYRYGVYRLRTFNLRDIASGVGPSHQIRFRITLPRGTALANYTELVGLTLSFRLVDTPNVDINDNERMAWQFTIAGTDIVELEDGSNQRQAVSEHWSSVTGEESSSVLQQLRVWLWSWAVQRKRLYFVDVNGRNAYGSDSNAHLVVIDSISEVQPVVLPGIEDENRAPYPAGVTRDVREAFFTVTLVETSDSDDVDDALVGF